MLKGCTVLVDGLSSSMRGCLPGQLAQSSNLGANCKVYSSCEVTNGRMCWLQTWVYCPPYKVYLTKFDS